MAFGSSGLRPQLSLDMHGHSVAVPSHTGTPTKTMPDITLTTYPQVALDLAATTMFPPKTTPNTSLESGVAILTEISLTPLFMSTASVLNMCSGPKGRRMQWILMMLNIPLLLSLILIIAGGIDPDSRDGPTFAATESTKAGIALYCATFVVLIWATTIIAARLYLANPLEVKILTTVVLSLPFFLVDVIYMMCFAFETLWGPQQFNVISGNVTLQLCMYVPYPFCRGSMTCSSCCHATLANHLLGKLLPSISLLVCT
jgi:hypothetical protein